ncbi:BORG1 protein, partial [Atractosteus spatula]|nr:BORG1 protein [Atractosteus spatula]
MSAKAPIYLKRGSRKGKKEKLRDLLSSDMISPPLGDFRHTIHIGSGGGEGDLFGDLSFLQGKFHLLPGRQRPGEGGFEFARTASVCGGHPASPSPSSSSSESSPLLKNAISLPWVPLSLQPARDEKKEESGFGICSPRDVFFLSEMGEIIRQPSTCEGPAGGHKCRQPGGTVHLEPRPGETEQPPVDRDQERERCADPTEKEPELLNNLRRFLCMDPVTGTTGEVCEICPSNWHKGPNGTCYFVSSEGKSWDFSHKACSVLGAHLAVIQDREELEMLRGVTLTGFRYWIGLSSNGSARWRWLDGTQLLTNVVTDGDDSHRSCGYLRGTISTFHSDSCSTELRWVCEQSSVRL